MIFTFVKVKALIKWTLDASKRKKVIPIFFWFFVSRYHGEDDDRMSVASRKMTSYAKTDCVGASKGLFFGLLTLVSGLICLILFFVLIDHDNQQVGNLSDILVSCPDIIMKLNKQFFG